MLTNQTIDPSRDPNQKPFILWRPFIASWQWLFPPTLAHQDRQSGIARWIAGGLIAIICVTLTVLAILYAKPIQDRYQDWRAEGLVDEARQLAENGQIVNAVMKAQEAYGMAPDNVKTLRINGEFFTMMKRNEAIYFLEKLEDQGAATSSDIQLKIRALMNTGQKKEAEFELEKLLKSEPLSESLMALSEELWGVRDQNSNLLPLLADYVEKNPNDLENRLRLATVQVNSSLPGATSDGIETLWELAERNDPIGIQAIDALAQLDSLPPDENEHLIERLQSHPDATGWHFVKALNKRITANPGRRTNIILEAIANAEGKSREDLVPIVRWLVEEKEYLQVLALVPLEEAKSYQPILENYLTALTMLGRNSELKEIVNDPKIEGVINRTVLSFYRAHLAFVTQEPEDVFRTELITAKNAAALENRGKMLLSIARYAENRGHNDIAEEAYRDAALNKLSERPGYEGLLRSTIANGNTEGLFRAAREAVRRWPDDQAYVERYLYACLLLGLDIELSIHHSLKLLKTQPNNHTGKLIAALGHWRIGDYSSASNYLQYMDLNKLTEGQRAVYAGIAEDAGFQEEARAIIGSIASNATMMPEERSMFDAIQR